MQKCLLCENGGGPRMPHLYQPLVTSVYNAVLYKNNNENKIYFFASIFLFDEFPKKLYFVQLYL